MSVSNDDLRNVLDVISRILLRCFVIGFLVLLFWAVCILAAGDMVFDIHGKMFDISRHDFNVIHYGGMTCLKTFVFMVFFTPYLAIRLVLNRLAPPNAPGP